MKPRVPISERLRKAANDVLSEDETVREAANAIEKERPFVRQPSSKPPRRKKFNTSATREYRNEYQAQYRQDNGNG